MFSEVFGISQSTLWFYDYSGIVFEYHVGCKFRRFNIRKLKMCILFPWENFLNGSAALMFSSSISIKIIDFCSHQMLAFCSYSVRDIFVCYHHQKYMIFALKILIAFDYIHTKAHKFYVCFMPGGQGEWLECRWFQWKITFLYSLLPYYYSQKCKFIRLVCVCVCVCLYILSFSPLFWGFSTLKHRNTKKRRIKIKVHQHTIILNINIYLFYIIMCKKSRNKKS